MREAVITSSVLILCIALLRQLCKGRISAGLQYALWLIVAVRLIVPGIAVAFPNILPESNLSIMNAANRIAGTQGYGAQPEISGNHNIMLGELPFLTADSEDGPTAVFLAAGSVPVWSDLFKGIWYLGIVIAGAWMLAVNIIFMRKLRKSRIRYEKEGFSLPASLPVYLAKDLDSPCLYGLPGQQAIYLPDDVAENEEKIKHILAHEYCHYKHRDIFWSALRCIITAVYWFHPLVWLAAVLSKQDCELACDEAAIRLLGEEERVAYGKTLVSLITRKTKASDIVCTATTMTGGLESVKERVRRIAEKPHRLMIALIPVIVAVCAAAVFTFTQAKEDDGAHMLEGEDSLTVTTDCFQVTFPDYFAKKAYYRGEKGTDIIVYHKDSDKEIGRFCMRTYEEATQLADEKEVILIGSYGANDALNSYIRGYGMLYHTDIFVDHTYTPAGEDGAVGVPGTDGAAGVPATDSNDDTTYIVPNEQINTEYTPSESSQTYYPAETEKPNPASEHIYTPDTPAQSEGDVGVPGTDSNIEIEYLPNEQIIILNGQSEEAHTYTPAELENAAGIPGTDSNNDETAYILHENRGDVHPIPAPEDVDAELINLPYEDGIESIMNEPSGAPNEHSVDYLPNERVVVSNRTAITTESPCYLYIPADNSDAGSNLQTELTEMNQKLIELTDYVSVLSVSEGSMQEALDIMLANRTPYVGDAARTSKIAAAIPATTGLEYQYLEMQTATEPYEVTIYYNLYADYGSEDENMQFLGAVLMFASIENLGQCNIQIRDTNNPILADSNAERRYTREEMEELFGALYPCSETKEDFVGLYNRVLEYLDN